MSHCLCPGRDASPTTSGQFREIEWLVDAELLLRSEDAVLTRLGEIEARALSRPQLGDHLLVVGDCDLDLDPRLLRELLAPSNFMIRTRPNPAASSFAEVQMHWPAD